MCFGDFSPTLCHQCVLNATQTISSQCPSSKEAIIWYNHCLLHYSDRPSLSALDTSPAYKHLNIVNYTSNPNQLQSFFTSYGSYIATPTKSKEKKINKNVVPHNDICWL
uniref:Cysteine-rich repeat secretory protein 1 n=1 Tax=Cajanus cajan TaxID=3821 RepID=A0A151U710_CAJCA|nr:Cysteine-rich repeat secretory protein 1 [Cajanus cajan]